ncbi:hypothetical protein C0216_20000 [Streptomyces globosus]|uniref:SLC26A/SulP transporter domain-containing protein n=1 Tax=Streptomyces globosus TaxID=68209 RepID=A0A344U3F6_9ACTN|nr:hypothetical protein C0216_20000 [Streptomyces globosus]
MRGLRDDGLRGPDGVVKAVVMWGWDAVAGRIWPKVPRNPGPGDHKRLPEGRSLLSSPTHRSPVLHGVWLLLFAALFPAALSAIPVAALAGVLIHAGAKLLPAKELGPRWREHRGEAVVLAVTAIAIVATDMFEGVPPSSPHRYSPRLAPSVPCRIRYAARRASGPPPPH